MRTALFLITAAVCWVVLGYKLRVLRRDPANPFLRSFCATIALIALTLTLAPAVVAWLEGTTGVLEIWNGGVVVVGCTAVQTTLLLWTHPAERAWPRIRVRWVVNGLALAAMIVLDVSGRIDARTIDFGAYREDPMALYGTTPYVAEATLIYVAVLAFTSVDATRQFWRYAKVVERRWLHRGLRLLAVGCSGNILTSLSVMATVAAQRFTSRAFMPPHESETLLSTICILTASVGTTLPVLGPRVDRFRTYRQLRPLWQAVYDAVPEVALDPPAGPWRLRDLSHRLYRQVIEIRDGHLALRPYLDEDIATRAARLGRQAGLDGDRLQATVEAATLAAAIQAKSRGYPAATRPMRDDDTRGGDDLTAELGWLTQVAEAFTNSPVVRAAAFTPTTQPAPTAIS